MSLIQQLSQTIGTDEGYLAQFLLNAASKYKVYKIPKRRIGFRLIAQPSKELKQLQRDFLKLVSLPVHDRAYAYRKGRNIKSNASIHKDSRYLLKIDFENFFNSINPTIFWNAIEANGLKNHPIFDNREIINQLIFWNPSKKVNGKLILSVGAPSSPLISNFCLFTFDKIISEYCLKNGINYSRYADDLSFSSNEKRVLDGVLNFVKMTLFREYGHRIRINNSKVVFSGRSQNRHVTGITITPSADISVGRKRKRYVKHLISEFSHQRLNESEIARLRGLLAFIREIEPSFITSMYQKYSLDLMNHLC